MEYIDEATTNKKDGGKKRRDYETNRDGEKEEEGGDGDGTNVRGGEDKGDDVRVMKTLKSAMSRLEKHVEMLNKELHQTKKDLNKKLSFLENKLDYLISVVEHRNAPQAADMPEQRHEFTPSSSKAPPSPPVIVDAKPICQVPMDELSDEEDLGEDLVVKRKRPMRKGKYLTSPFVDPTTKRTRTSNNELQRRFDGWLKSKSDKGLDLGFQTGDTKWFGQLLTPDSWLEGGVS